LHAKKAAVNDENEYHEDQNEQEEDPRTSIFSGQTTNNSINQ
jgi:hypothetical protein